MSSRRASPEDCAAAAEDDADEPKERMSASFPGVRISAAAAAFFGVFFLLLLVLICAARAQPRPVVCGSPYDALTRSALLVRRLDGLATDFGSLGVPWCMTPF